MTSTAAALLSEHPLLADGRHLIGGGWVESASGERIDVCNPATGDVLLTVPRGAAADIDIAVQAAADAYPAWRDTSPTRRAELISAWAAKIAERASDLDALESQEVGRPSWGPPPMARMLTYYAGLVDKVSGVTLPTHQPSTLALTVREPFGVVGSIIPWNAPGPLFVTDVGPAIGAGNTIVVKPAEDAPLTALALARLALDAGIPPGVVNVVTGYGAEAGAALPAHPGIKRMSFTGSPATGSAVMTACARNLIPLHLELGGKSPQVVMDDADLDRAVPAIVRSITLNTGQICAAGSRVVVDRRVHAELVARVADAFSRVRVGQWHEPVDMGPLINAKQERRVLDYLAAGQADGARLVTGGHKLSGPAYDRGYFVEATLFDDVDPAMRIAQEEIFGPVLAVVPVQGEDEAIAVANGVEYGLAASIWSQNSGRAIRLAKAVQAGQVAVNCAGSFGAIGAPFGGYKHSGFGRTMGADAVLDYTQVKTVVVDAAG